MKISILIPVFNAEKYLRKCINSIINQSYDNLEIIIVNDGSSDSSEQIIMDFLKIDNRIKYIYQSNEGICSVRNKLINTFSGDYALFVDSDDMLEKNACEELVDVVKSKAVDMITFNYKRIYDNGDIYDEFDIDNNVSYYSGKQAAIEYIYNNPKFGMVLWRRLYKKELLKKINFDLNILPEDYLTAFSFYINSNEIASINKSYYYYYIKDNGLTIRKGIDNCLASLKVNKIVYQQEKEYFNENNYLKRVNSIYVNSLLNIFSDLYINYKKNSINHCEEIKNELKKFNFSNLEFKSFIALCLFYFNKKLLCNYLIKRRKINLIKR